MKYDMKNSRVKNEKKLEPFSLLGYRSLRLRKAKGERVIIQNSLVIDISFSADVVKDTRFFNCRFINCSFETCVGVTFAQCDIEKCVFRGSNIVSLRFDDLVFFDCRLQRLFFTSCRLGNVQFLRCDFDEEPKFVGVVCAGSLRFNSNKGITHHLFVEGIEARVAHGALIQFDPQPRASLIGWGALRVLQRMPFLNLSVSGVLLLSIISVAIQIISSVVVNLTELCSISIADKACSSLKISILYTQQEFISPLLIMFLLLFVGSVVHLLRSPEICLDFSQNQWTHELNKPAIQYQILSASRAWSLGFCLVFYLMAAVIFIYRLLIKVIEVLFVSFSF